MRRIKLVLALAAATMAMLVASIPPATASPEDSIVFFPLGNGATYSCAGDPPFVFDPAGTGNCSIEQIGAPIGLVCDVSTTLTFVHEGHEWVSDASLCH